MKTPKASLPEIHQFLEAITHGIDQIWIQQMSDTPDAVKIAREAGVRLVTRQCIFMWLNR